MDEGNQQNPNTNIDSEDSADMKNEDMQTINQTPESSQEISEEPTHRKFMGMKLSKKQLLLFLGVGLIIVSLLVAWLLTRSDTVDVSLTQVDDSSQNEPAPLSMGAAVTYIDGTVEYMVEDEWVDVESGMSLVAGQMVRTGDASRAIVTFDDGSAIRLNENTQVALSELLSDSIVVMNEQGEVYSRVVASESRVFSVESEEHTYTALGTAYRTTNTDDKEGVEVFHSTVKVDEETDVKEGEGYFNESQDEEKEKVVELDKEGLKDDEFLQWNKDQDEKEQEFSDKLGFLEDIDKEEEKEEEKPEEEETDDGPRITANGETTEKGIRVNWSSKGVSTSYGYKVVFSSKDSTPTYGEDSSKFVEAGSSTILLELTDGKTWYVRVCSYRGDAGCKFYSNTVTLKAPFVEKEKVVSGAVSASLDGSVLSWTFSGTAPYGFKVVWNTTGSPTYPASGENAGSKLTDGSSINLGEIIEGNGTFKVRICKYTNGTQEDKCVDYSNEIEFVKS